MEHTLQHTESNTLIEQSVVLFSPTVHLLPISNRVDTNTGWTEVTNSIHCFFKENDHQSS